MFQKKVPLTPPPARVLLSIDYEPWFALSRRYDSIHSDLERRSLDGGFARQAVDVILEQLGMAAASFYLVGEIAAWYPEVAEKIAAAGHELGFHCHVHRSLALPEDLEQDLQRSQDWIKRYGVRGYRAPMVRIAGAAYPLLARFGFRYSSSIYAPPGTLLQNAGVWELPVSTWKWGGSSANIQAPRYFSVRLLLGGELPFGSSFITGLSRKAVLRLIENALKAGHSPVIFLHPYELARPEDWPGRIRGDLLRNPLLLPFVADKSGFLKQLVGRFPVSPLGAWLDDAIRGGCQDG
ncbi:MAG: polysaccharide deacetylase family protein [Anaerolineae bacterium]|nr:polysaccharide deacetylase family protein [Anaerolineae bacterium]